MIITVDMSKKNSIESLDEHLQLIARHAREDVVVVIAGTKVDQTDNSLLIEENKQILKEFYDNLNRKNSVLGFVSSKANYNIEELFQTTAKVVIKQIEEKEILRQKAQSPSEKDKSDLIEKLKTLTSDSNFWSDKIRLKSTEIPTGIKYIHTLLSNGKDKPEEMLHKIKKYADHKHSSMFQWAHHLFRGRDDSTNKLYQILSNVSVSNTYEYNRSMKELNEFINKYKPKDKPKKLIKTKKIKKQEKPKLIKPEEIQEPIKSTPIYKK